MSEQGFPRPKLRLLNLVQRNVLPSSSLATSLASWSGQVASDKWRVSNQAACQTLCGANKECTGYGYKKNGAKTSADGICYQLKGTPGSIKASQSQLLDLGRTPYVLYEVKYIDLVSLEAKQASQSQKFTPRPFFFQNGAKSGFEMCFGPSTLGAGAKTRRESRIKEFTPHCICRPTSDAKTPRKRPGSSSSK